VEAQLPAIMGQASFSSAESSALQAVAVFNTNDASGLSSALPAFFSALQALSANPSDTSLRSAALAAATSLTQAFNATSQGISGAQDGLDQQVEGSIPQANQLAAQIASLNQQIRVAQASGSSPNSLIDTRQQAQDQLEQLTGATPVPDKSGDVNLVLPGGQSLVSGDQAATLSTVPDPSNDGHLLVQIQESSDSAPTSIADSGLGGTLGGSLAARDGALAQAGQGLDSLAYNLATAVNAVQSTGYGTDGSTGNDLFEIPPTATGAAAQISVNATVAANPQMLAAASSATAPGDGTNLQQILDLQDAPLAGGSCPADTLASVVSAFGAASQTATNNSTADAAVQTGMIAQRLSVSGVSSNEEVINLTQAQQAYQAVSQVVQTTNNLLNSLMSMMTVTG
jgi:flagellar hook-associated protein 1 FlgK